MWSSLLPLLLLGNARAQLLDALFPAAGAASRQLAGALLERNPLLEAGAGALGGALASTADLLTRVPLAVARGAGVGRSLAALPGLASNTNIVGLADAFLGDFNAGLANQDARLSVDQLIVKYGHPVERHEVMTDDGYLLAMFRIPGAGPTVLLMHGLLGSADDFVVAGAGSGLAYLLARDGYDVWLGNARGNKHSRRHVELQPTDAAFWDFSWHEIGCYDLPAMIDYVLDETNSTQLKYIGHSQGTTSFFVMASERPDYNEKISVMIALSPVAFMEHVKSPIVRILAPGGGFIHVISKSVGVYEFLPDDVLMKFLKSVLCGIGPVSEILCNNVMFLMTGFDYGQLNVTNLPVVLGHMPSGCAVKQFAHYGQGVVAGDFQQFDHGAAGNRERYGGPTPPRYRLERVAAPVALFFSDEDWLAHPRDVARLRARLRNVVHLYKVPHQRFNHLDFLLAKDFKALIYNRLWKILEYY